MSVIPAWLAARWNKRWTIVSGGVAVFAACVAARQFWGADEANARAPFGAASASPQVAQPADPKQNHVATVNGEVISRNDLQREALRHYGSEVLESLINKHMINDACQKSGLGVTSEEVSAEIDRMAQRFGVPRDHWLKMLEEERHIKPAQYAKDIIWPTIALRKLAAQHCEPTEDEVQQAYETQYGPAVKARIIVCESAEKAKAVWTMAVQKPDDFGDLAKQHSVDANTAVAKGLVPPIRKHLGDINIERAAFAMLPGQVSDPIQVGEKWVILKCESHVEAARVDIKLVHQTLKEACRDKKLRFAANDIVQELHERSQIENFYADPARGQQMPGVAAVINGKKITVLELADECIERHGLEVLDGTINRRLIEQQCRKHNITISEADLTQEIARAAVSMGKIKPDGAPDIDAWLQHVLAEQKLTFDRYRHDIVWPSVALKKLVGNQAEVTAIDIQKGYEANFGERVRCRAIVFNNHRKAIEVWEMARAKPTVEYFGDLAEQYSVEASSRALRGEVPIIHRNSSQPALEAAAYQLNPGELSEIVEVDKKWVVMFCEARIPAANLPLQQVEEAIRADVAEKEFRAAMAKQFNDLQEEAAVENYLAGTIHSPASHKKKLDQLTQGAATPAPVR